MARIRTIKPDMFASLGRQGVSIGARWFMAGMVTYADDHGRFEWMPRKVLGCLFPEDPGVSEQDVADWLSELVSIGVIEMYEVCGRAYGHFPKWLQHQRVKNPSKSYLPDPETSRHVSTVAEGQSKSYGESTEDVPQSGALEIGNRSIGSRKEEVGVSLASASGASGDDAEVIEAEIVPEPSEPYATVERVLMAMDGKPVPASKVRRYLRDDSPIRGLVAQYGEADATRLIIWAAKHKRLNVATVYGSSGVLWDEAVAANWGPPHNGRHKGWGDPAEDVDRMVDEHNKLLAARAEEDRYIRENWS